jgi:hypothetical protein
VLQVEGLAENVLFVPAIGFNQTYHLEAPIDGILGLSFQGDAQGLLRSPKTNLINVPVFSFYIKK